MSILLKDGYYLNLNKSIIMEILRRLIILPRRCLFTWAINEQRKYGLFYHIENLESGNAGNDGHLPFIYKSVLSAGILNPLK